MLEKVHHFLMHRYSERSSFSVSYVQLDNCFKENENAYLVSYFEAFGASFILNLTKMSISPTGHTLEDIDQLVSWVSKRVCSKNTVILSE